MTGSPKKNGESKSIFNLKIFEKIEHERDLKKRFSSLESAFYGLFGQLKVEFELKKSPNSVNYSVKAHYKLRMSNAQEVKYHFVKMPKCDLTTSDRERRKIDHFYLCFHGFLKSLLSAFW